MDTVCLVDEMKLHLGFAERVSGWLPANPDGYLMADRTLHRANCPLTADPALFDCIAGAHKSRYLLMLRAEMLWGTWAPCGVCLPDGDDRDNRLASQVTARSTDRPAAQV